MSDYKYLHYCVPIDYTLLDNNWAHKSDEVDKLVEFLKIDCNLKIVTNAYLVNSGRFEYLGKGDVFVFFDHSLLRFIVFDLYHGYTDQNDMIILGVKCKSSEFEQVHKIMKNIYDKCCPKSAFTIDDIGTYLEDLVKTSNYPKLIEDSGHKSYQNIFIYQGGKIVTYLSFVQIKMSKMLIVFL